MKPSLKITLQPIGTVKNSIKEPIEDDWKSIVSEIVVHEKYKQALEQIEGFSHIVVLYWMSHIKPNARSILRVHPKKRNDLPLVGVFATRSPVRPNPIGLTTVRLLKRKANVLKVKGLDAIDGTPVLDIKPYIPGYDLSRRARMPTWIKSIRKST